MKDQQLSWFVVIPAPVLLDRNLTDPAKLLYGVISGLTREQGYCWATNKYLAERSGQAISTMRRNLARLEERGYITTEVRTKGKEVVERRIYLGGKHTPMLKNEHTPMLKNEQDNNKEENNKLVTSSLHSEVTPDASASPPSGGSKETTEASIGPIAQARSALPVGDQGTFDVRESFHNLQPLEVADFRVAGEESQKERKWFSKEAHAEWVGIMGVRGVTHKAATRLLGKLKKQYGLEEVEKALIAFPDEISAADEPFLYLQGIIIRERHYNQTGEWFDIKKAYQNSSTLKGVDEDAFLRANGVGVKTPEQLEEQRQKELAEWKALAKQNEKLREQQRGA